MKNMTYSTAASQHVDGKDFLRKFVRAEGGSIISMQHYVNDQPVSRADYNDALTTAELNEINRNAAINVGPN